MRYHGEEAQPYTFAEFAAAVNRASEEKRGVLASLETAIGEKADAEGDYARTRARAIEACKTEHGSVAGVEIGKGRDDVATALQRVERARDMVKAWHERARLGSEDRASLHRLGEWSRSANEGFENA